MKAQPIDLKWMQEALRLAEHAAQIGEIPVGALVIFEDKIVGTGFNRRETDKSPMAHAEILAIEEAAQTLKRWRLSGCTLYVTLEPCVMCAGALVNARVDRLIYGAKDPKAGGIESLYQIASDARLNHRLKEIQSGVLELESAALIRGFFKLLRT